MPSYATPDGTRKYASRFYSANSDPADQKTARGHFRERDGLHFSSIGIGTYLGEPDAVTDRGYTESVVAAVEGGINVIDTAINYRFQRSERSIGAALKTLAIAGYGREEIFLCTKAGFLTPDGSMPADPADYFFKEYAERGIFGPQDIAAGCHCMAPKYLANQLDRSRRNMDVERVDVFYLHNPETQLAEIPQEEFLGRIRAAFEFCESAAADGKLQFYGVATWNGFRQDPGAKDHLSLEALVGIATEVGGENHRMRFVQMPFNLGMPEALVRPTQKLGARSVSMVQAARPLNVTLITSAPTMQGQLAHNLPKFVAESLGLSTDFERAVQFARSAPGITTALIGMSRVEHVRANLPLAAVPPANREQILRIFQQTR